MYYFYRHSHTENLIAYNSCIHRLAINNFNSNYLGRTNPVRISLSPQWVHHDLWPEQKQFQKAHLSHSSFRVCLKKSEQFSLQAIRHFIIFHLFTLSCIYSKHMNKHSLYNYIIPASHPVHHILPDPGTPAPLCLTASAWMPSGLWDGKQELF